MVAQESNDFAHVLQLRGWPVARAADACAVAAAAEMGAEGHVVRGVHGAAGDAAVGNQDAVLAASGVVVIGG